MADSFEDLSVYRHAFRFSTSLYKRTLVGVMRQDFAFTDQLRRALLSITNNIAEGYERDLVKEKRYFFRVAKGSAGEVRSMLHFAVEIHYITKEEHETYCAAVRQVSRQLAGYARYLAR